MSNSQTRTQQSWPGPDKCWKGLRCQEGAPDLSLPHLCLLTPDKSCDSRESLLTKNDLCFSLTQALIIA